MPNDLIALLMAAHWVFGVVILVSFAVGGEAYARRLIAILVLVEWLL